MQIAEFTMNKMTFLGRLIFKAITVTVPLVLPNVNIDEGSLKPSKDVTILFTTILSRFNNKLM
jgi:hypothetical protein